MHIINHIDHKKQFELDPELKIYKLVDKIQTHKKL